MSVTRLHRRPAAESHVEKSIITGMITSNTYLKSIAPSFNPKYFRNNYAGIVAKWVMRYYDQYKECPSTQIKDIYKVEKEKLKEADADLIATFLDDLSRKYENESKFNVQYLIDRTYAHFKEMALTLVSENIAGYLALGEIDKAEGELGNYKQVARSISGWVNPFDLDYIEKVYDGDMTDDEKPNYLFKLIGPVGDHLGHFERDWLVAFLAPMKKGKTFWLQELALQAIGARLNTVVISLEMSDGGMTNRFFKMITGKGEKNCTIFPTFDCQSNQNGLCSKPERVNSYTLYKNNILPSSYDPKLSYKTCTECRGKTNDYRMAMWFETIQKSKLSLLDIKRTMSGFQTMYGNGLRLKSYPAYSANIQTIKRDLEILEITEDFVPDVIIVDYADILSPESSQFEGRDRYDETWKMLKNLAAVKHCLVVTASQSNRKTLDKKDVKASDISEDIRKVAHVDAMFSLSQTPEEKSKGTMRLGVVAHRWRDFNELSHCTVLQQLQTGQVALDSEINREY